jgi:hypothetical protein
MWRIVFPSVTRVSVAGRLAYPASAAADHQCQKKISHLQNQTLSKPMASKKFKKMDPILVKPSLISTLKRAKTQWVDLVMEWYHTSR